MVGSLGCLVAPFPPDTSYALTSNRGQEQIAGAAHPPPLPPAASCTEQPADKEPLLSIPRTTQRHKAAFPLTSALCLTSQCLSEVLASQPHPDVATLRLSPRIASLAALGGTSQSRRARAAQERPELGMEETQLSPERLCAKIPFCSRILGRCFPFLPKSRNAQLEDGGIWGGFTRGGSV